MGSASHAVHVNGLCASRMFGRSRAFAAAADAVAARPDAVVSVVRYHDGRVNAETVAVVHRPDAAPADCAPSGAWCGTDGVRPSLAFANVADALAYATGHAAPSPRAKRRRTITAR